VTDQMHNVFVSPGGVDEDRSTPHNEMDPSVILVCAPHVQQIDI